MRVAILSSPPDLSAYVAEIFKTWGLALFDVVEPNAVADLDPSPRGGGEDDESRANPA